MSSPGILHFDLRRGCTADMLNASMSHLLNQPLFLTSVMNSLGLGGVSVVTEEIEQNQTRGMGVYFYLEGQLLTLPASAVPSPKIAGKCVPIFERVNLPKVEIAKLKPVSARHPFLDRCLGDERITLSEIGDFLRLSEKFSSSALAQEVLRNLDCQNKNPSFLGTEALWLLCQLVSLVSLLDALDPQFVSASKIVVPSTDVVLLGKLVPQLQSTTWINQILRGLPCIHLGTSINVDALALAFIKTVCGRFGERGAGSIKRVAIGWERGFNNYPNFTEALWCESEMPDTITSGNSTEAAQRHALHEVVGLVPSHTAMGEVVLSLQKAGALELTYWLVHEGNHTKYQVRFLVGHNEKDAAVELFLVKAYAVLVSLKTVEVQKLTHRPVSVPLGTGNQQTTSRFMEYLYGDRVVRVEPLEEDLLLYMRNTDFSMDVARQDLLMAWKKWRAQQV